MNASSNRDPEVLIVGAGPTGLALALWLTRLGVRVRIVDKTAEPGTTSRAVGVQARTLEFYSQLGLADEIVACGRKAPAANLWVTGKKAARFFFGDMGADISPFPYALVAVMLVSAVLFYALGKGLFGRDAYAMMAKATSGGGPKPLPRPQAWICTALFAGVTFVAMLPHLGVVLVAFSSDWYATVLPHRFNLHNFQIALGHDLTVPAIANSLKYASIATVLDLILGVLLAYVIVRSKLAGRQILDFLAMLPLAVPGLVLAFGYLAMSQDGKFFAFLNPVRDPTILLIIAYAIRRLPYVVRSAAAGFQQTSETLEEAAQNLGCPPLKAVFKVTLPLIMANLIAGGLLAFAFAMLEVSDSLVLAQKQAYYPITKAIYELFQLLGDGKFIASALGVWAMAFLGIAIAGMTILLGKKLGALFRV